MRLLIAALSVSAFLILACTEVTQTTGPTTVESGEAAPESRPAETISPASPASGTLSLEPDSIAVAVGKTVYVKVIVTDAQGVEVDSEAITSSVADTSVLKYTGTDARTISFVGVSVGSTSVIISASGLQASLVATVTTD